MERREPEQKLMFGNGLISGRTVACLYRRVICDERRGAGIKQSIGMSQGTSR